jgi:hypothetical protein
MKTYALFACVIALTFAVGCSKQSAPHAAHEHDHAPGAEAPAHHHAHVAPNGGTLVELGDHQFNLELVHDAATGTLNVFALDAHAENFLRLSAPSLAVMITANGETRSLTLAAVANAATGETRGDTAQFSAQADWLKTTAGLALVFPELDFRGTFFRDVQAALPASDVSPR